MSELPDKYNYDYTVFSASTSFSEEEELWLADFDKVVLRMMFKKFNNYVEKSYLDK
jgi:hypothetical protein